MSEKSCHESCPVKSEYVQPKTVNTPNMPPDPVSCSCPGEITGTPMRLGGVQCGKCHKPWSRIVSRPCQACHDPAAGFCLKYVKFCPEFIGCEYCGHAESEHR